jgi:hypothetical protein
VRRLAERGAHRGLTQTLAPLITNLLVGLGDARERVERSMARLGER